MEVRVNLALLVVLAVVWGALCSTEPVAAMDPHDPQTQDLARLEDALAARPTDARLAERLAERYLDLGEPGLAVAALRSADPSVLEDPLTAHRLAQAYEQSGRVSDALATANLALARCTRTIGTDEVQAAMTPVPRYDCSERTLAALELHQAALDRMSHMGVSDPTHDLARAARAYQLATRSARVAMSE
jgi:tetratricopeptide (TPR) repeat protein